MSTARSELGAWPGVCGGTLICAPLFSLMCAMLLPPAPMIQPTWLLGTVMVLLVLEAEAEAGCICIGSMPPPPGACGIIGPPPPPPITGGAPIPGAMPPPSSAACGPAGPDWPSAAHTQGGGPPGESRGGFSHSLRAIMARAFCSCSRLPFICSTRSLSRATSGSSSGGSILTLAPVSSRACLMKTPPLPMMQPAWLWGTSRRSCVLGLATSEGSALAGAVCSASISFWCSARTALWAAHCSKESFVLDETMITRSSEPSSPSATLSLEPVSWRTCRIVAPPLPMT
mmetsp:Transcript_3268/g.8208  ORF Transcript_3268/g.8208 Transcript_3268/m.8208 type:complete len:286 (-) Transcript_3268:396-1253(-)